jgi:hypothetical protein
MNLQKVKEAMSGVKVLSTEQRKTIADKVEYFLKYLEDTPKSGKWKGRAKTGTSKPWYKEVSDWA